MSNTFGALYIQGQQINLPGGGIQGIGQFAIPCSGVQQTLSQPLTSSNVSVTVPTGAAGMLIIPPADNVQPVFIAPINTATGLVLSGEFPSFLAFDFSDPPISFYMKSEGSNFTVTIQFI